MFLIKIPIKILLTLLSPFLHYFFFAPFSQLGCKPLRFSETLKNLWDW